MNSIETQASRPPSDAAVHQHFANHGMRRRIAIHEAGHAVAALLMGGSIERLQIAGPMKPVILRDGSAHFGSAAMTDTLPYVHSSDHVIERLNAADAIEKERIKQAAVGHVFILVAGPVAEATHTGRRFDRMSRSTRLGAQSDFSVAEYVLRPFSDNTAMAAATITAIASSAEQVLTHSKVWPAVRAVADAALSGIEDGRALEEIARRYLPPEHLVAPLLHESDGIGSYQFAGLAAA